MEQRLNADRLWQAAEGRLHLGLDELGLEATEEQRRQLIGFLQLLARWNQAYNLTAVDDPLEMVSKHLLDSLAVAPFVCGERILDLGTGAGLPGLPLAILMTERRFWLLDSNGKKIRFVRQAVLELGLGNVEPVQARIETYRPAQKFSTIVSRAVAVASLLPVLSSGLGAHPARWLLMKGRLDRSFAELVEAGYAPIVHPLRVPFLDAPRHLIELRSA